MDPGRTPLGGIAVAALAACSVRPESVQVEPAAPILYSAGATAQLRATPRDGTGKALSGHAVAFTSRSPEIATVSSTGLVTAVKSGRGTVVAAAGSATGAAEVHVAIPFGISMVPDALTLVGVGAKAELSAVLKDEAGDPVPNHEPTWLNDNPDVVQVEGGGKITTVGIGRATLQAEAAGIRARATVDVQEPPFESVRLTSRRLAVRVGEPARVPAQAVDAQGKPVPGAGFHYAVDDPEIAAVDRQGMLRGLARGRTRVVVTAGARRAELEVEVRK